MELEPIPDMPAMVVRGVRGGSVLIFSDVHLGFERVYRRKGFRVPSRVERYLERLEELEREVDFTRVVIAGDLKHTIPMVAPQEEREIPLFLEACSKLHGGVDVQLIPGNHDAAIEEYIPDDVELCSADGLVLEGDDSEGPGRVGICHGHSWPSRDTLDCDILLMGHNHPHVRFRDEVGGRETRPCWVRIPVDEDRYSDKGLPTPGELILLPPFSLYGQGVIMNDPEARWLGPLMDNAVIDPTTTRVHLLDGTDMGKLSYLYKLHGPSRRNDGMDAMGRYVSRRGRSW